MPKGVSVKTTAKHREKASLHLRIDFGPEQALGPGQVRLLELCNETGSISAAGRALNMSYRLAWLLVDGLNDRFNAPVVPSDVGGGRGGGTALTETGLGIVRLYRDLERRAW